MKLQNVVAKNPIKEEAITAEHVLHIMPHVHPNDSDYDDHCSTLDHIKKTNPTLYKKMLAWD